MNPITANEESNDIWITYGLSLDSEAPARSGANRREADPEGEEKVGRKERE